MAERTNQNTTLVSKVPVRMDLWAEYKTEARRKGLKRTELLEEILKERYWNGKDQPPENREEA